MDTERNKRNTNKMSKDIPTTGVNKSFCIMVKIWKVRNNLHIMYLQWLMSMISYFVNLYLELINYIHGVIAKNTN